MRITFDDCYRDLLTRGAPEGRMAFDRWRANRSLRDVVPFVTRFEHEFIFSLDPGAVREIRERTRHALGDVRTEEQLKVVEDFTAPFALQHLFHWYIEHHKALPTWKEYRDWMVEGPASPHWYVILKKKLGEPRGVEERRQWSRAARWRLGKFYLSAMRELDILARLRYAGVDLRYHLLADVLLRADFWVGDIIVSIYFPNGRYRDMRVGRKPPAEHFFEGANPPVKIVHFPIERQGLGNFWLATDEQLSELLSIIQQQASL